jgi:hypothetical protein
MIVNFPQGELEHRTSKARYSGTNKREFIKQITQIERRQERIRRIRMRNLGDGDINPLDESVATNPDIHHCIAKSEAHPEHIGLFIKKNQGDPAVEVYALPSSPELSLMPRPGLHSKIEETSLASDSISTKRWRRQ